MKILKLLILLAMVGCSTIEDRKCNYAHAGETIYKTCDDGDFEIIKSKEVH